jgi:hypothetical protein
VTVVGLDPNEDPFTNILVGGDISGFHRSDDGGQEWLTSNTNLTNQEQRTIASVFYKRESGQQTVYAAFGSTAADDGGLLQSANGGAAWSPLTNDVDFNGQASGSDGPFDADVFPSQVRSTGNIIAVDEERVPEMIYVGSFRDGMYRHDVGAVWEAFALTPGRWRLPERPGRGSLEPMLHPNRGRGPAGPHYSIRGDISGWGLSDHGR